MHGNYSGFLLFCFVLLSLDIIVASATAYLICSIHSIARSHAEQFRNFYSAISLCSSSYYRAFFTSSSNHSFDLSLISLHILSIRGYKCWKVFWHSPSDEIFGPPQFNTAITIAITMCCEPPNPHHFEWNEQQRRKKIRFKV